MWGVKSDGMIGCEDDISFVVTKGLLASFTSPLTSCWRNLFGPRTYRAPCPIRPMPLAPACSPKHETISPLYLLIDFPPTLSVKGGFSGYPLPEQGGAARNHPSPSVQPALGFEALLLPNPGCHMYSVSFRVRRLGR